MKKSNKLKLFVFEIKINSNEWNYKKGQKIMIPIQSNNSHNAYMKFDNKYNGSEFPNYKLIVIHECDKFLFNPYNLFKDESK